MEIYIQRRLDNTFNIPYSSDHDKLKHIKVDDIVLCKITKPRNIGHHKKFFTLIEFVFQNQEAYNNREHLRRDLTIEAGFYDEHLNFWKEKVKEAKSISFAKMDQIEFQKFYSRFIDAINRVYGFDKHDMLENIDQYYS